jgi:predicted oxidoreductase
MDLGKLAYGFMQYEEHDLDTAIMMTEKARDMGITHLDTADIYGHANGMGGAERVLGQIRQKAPSLLSGMTIATKGGIVFGTPYNSSRRYIEGAVDASLSRLGVERIDLFYIHRPDELTHPSELAATLDDLVAAGKVASIGVSNFRLAQIDSLRTRLNAPLVAHQIEFSVLHADPVMGGELDQAMLRDMAVPVWSPLAGGRLFKAKDVRAVRVRQEVERIAKKMGDSPTVIALSFVMTHPARTLPIIGTKNKNRLAEAALATDMTLERGDWYAIYEAAMGSKLP